MQPTASFELTRNDCEAYNKHVAASFGQSAGQQSFRIAMVTGFVTIAYLMFAVVFAVKPLAKQGIIFSGLLVVLLIAWFVEKRRTSANPATGSAAGSSNAAEALRQMEDLLLGPTQITLNEEGIAVDAPHVTSHIKWSGVGKVDEIDTHFFLGSLVIPKRCFTSDQALNAFRAAAQAGMASKPEK
jgi:YcxB-like protein